MGILPPEEVQVVPVVVRNTNGLDEVWKPAGEPRHVQRVGQPVVLAPEQKDGDGDGGHAVAGRLRVARAVRRLVGGGVAEVKLTEAVGVVSLGKVGHRAGRGAGGGVGCDHRE